jgi:protein-S-isoprenylcysteine O-methyltransferase Ste14
MARSAFKRWWTRIVPPLAERPIYVLLTDALLALIYWQWPPLPEPVWDLRGTVWASALWALFFGGWALVFLSSFLIDHFELFGLKHGVCAARGRSLPPPRFRAPSLHRLMRHPLMLGLLLAFWSAPMMSQGRLLFAGVTTAYILVAIRLEERDLASALGDDYQRYRRSVSMLLPLPRRKA